LRNAASERAPSAAIRHADGLIALAPTDPLSPGTFSGLSQRLFAELQLQGKQIWPVASRRLVWSDAFSGALHPRAVLGRAKASRQSPLVSPNWLWSRRGFDILNGRLASALADVPPGVPVLQVGTQTDPSQADPSRAFVTLTDCTVIQALAAGEFAVSRASRRVQEEAVACQRQVFENSHCVLVLSDWARDSVIHDYGVAPERVVTTGAGANISDPLPRARDVERPMVLFVGRDWDQKGGPLLLAAFRLLRKQAPRARLVVVGCTPPVEGEPGVEVTGVLDRSDSDGDLRMRRLYAQATCLALLSRFDAYPNVVLEAGLCGVPVVSTREGSRPEVVHHGETGLLIEDRRPEVLADALLSLVQEPLRSDAMSRKAQELVSPRYTWPVVAAMVAKALP
jgi:glycosyltransferase involved in cell wall biosynthesis